jgi:hypothetical protein
MTDRERGQQPDIPKGTDETAGDKSRSDRAADRKARESEQDDRPNPARTTTGNFSAPKFGSAGSGGAELEPGPERD